MADSGSTAPRLVQTASISLTDHGDATGQLTKSKLRVAQVTPPEVPRMGKRRPAAARVLTSSHTGSKETGSIVGNAARGSNETPPESDTSQPSPPTPKVLTSVSLPPAYTSTPESVANCQDELPANTEPAQRKDSEPNPEPCVSHELPSVFPPTDDTGGDAVAMPDVAVTREGDDADILRCMRDCSWHVVIPGNESRVHRMNFSSTFFASPRFSVPLDAKAVIIVASLLSPRNALVFVRQVVLEVVDCPPIIVVLKCDGHGGDRSETVKSMVEVQRMFIEYGAAAMVPLRGNLTSLVMDVELALHHAHDMADRISKMTNRFLADHDNRKFWPCAHRLFEALPRMKEELKETPKAGMNIGCYYLVKCIGEGSFSKVFLADNTHTKCCEALKVIPKEKLLELHKVVSLSNELRLLSRLRHENIAELKSVGHSCYHILILMEYAGQVNLYKYLKSLVLPLEVRQVSECFRQIVSAVAYCHAQGVAHRDLKPENIVVDNTTHEGGPVALKIVDFGSSVETSQRVRGSVGTMPFMPPETLLSCWYTSAPVDMWALGVILIELCCGIGKFAKFMNWPHKVAPRPERGQELMRALEHPDGLQHFLEEDLGHVGSPGFPDYFYCAILGLVQPFEDRRPRAADVETVFTSVSGSWLDGLDSSAGRTSPLSIDGPRQRSMSDNLLR